MSCMFSFNNGCKGKTSLKNQVKNINLPLNIIADAAPITPKKGPQIGFNSVKTDSDMMK